MLFFDCNCPTTAVCYDCFRTPRTLQYIINRTYQNCIFKFATIRFLCSSTSASFYLSAWTLLSALILLLWLLFPVHSLAALAWSVGRHPEHLHRTATLFSPLDLRTIQHEDYLPSWYLPLSVPGVFSPPSSRNAHHSAHTRKAYHLKEFSQQRN